MNSDTCDSCEIPAREGNIDIIIRGGIAITMAGDREMIQNPEISIADGRIVGIGERGENSPEAGSRTEVIDASGGIILPGLVNSHTHAAMTLFRGLADDLPLKQWLFDTIFPAEARFLDPETVYWCSLLGCMEMLASGTTCFADGYFFQDETVRSVHESGIRALVAQGLLDFAEPGVGDPKDNMKVARNFIEKWVDFSELLTPGIFCHSPVTCSANTLKEAWEISSHFDLPLQIHLSETSDEVDEIIKKTGKRPVHYLDDLGLIGNRLIAAHAVYLDEGEIMCLGEKGGRVVHLPESNMKLCSGVSRIPDMIRMGVTVGLGTDGAASNNNLDMFQEMDSAAKLSKIFEMDPVGMNAQTVLKMATIGGAAVLGFDKLIGSIEIGKRADIIIVDTRSPHLCPIYDPVSTLVYSACGGDVRDVIVNGQVLLRGKKFTRINPYEVIEKVRKICKNITI